MTREELKAHCERQVQQFERVEKIMPVTPNDWKRYEEHKLILELLEQEPILDKIRAEIKKSSHGKWYVGRLDGKTEEVLLLDEVLQIIDKYRGRRNE